MDLVCCVHSWKKKITFAAWSQVSDYGNIFKVSLWTTNKFSQYHRNITKRGCKTITKQTNKHKAWEISIYLVTFNDISSPYELCLSTFVTWAENSIVSFYKQCKIGIKDDLIQNYLAGKTKLTMYSTCYHPQWIAMASTCTCMSYLAH